MIQSILIKQLQLISCRLKGEGRGKNFNTSGITALLE